MEVEGCSIPEDRLYDPAGEAWVRPLSSGHRLEVGVVAAFAAFAGRFRSVTYIVREGSLHRGQGIALVESARAEGRLSMPVDGRIIERNEAVVRRPKLLNDHPYDAGWVVRIEPADPGTWSRELLSAEAFAPRLAERIRAARIRCYPAVPDVEMYEVGSECQATLVRLDEELARRGPDDVVLVVTDDPTSPIEMERWKDRSGHSVIHHRREGTLHHFLVRKEAEPRPAVRPG